MAFATYSDLKTSLANWLHRADLTNFLDDFITLGEDRIYRRLRVRAMEKSISGTIASGVLAVPQDFVQWKFAYVDRTPACLLEVSTPARIYQHYPTRSGGGLPKMIAREADNFIFGPYPDSSYVIKGVYYKRFDPLSTSVNDLYTTHPGLWLYAALIESAPFIGDDPRLPLWEAKFEQIVGELNAEEEGMTSGGAGLVMRA